MSHDSGPGSGKELNISFRLLGKKKNKPKKQLLEGPDKSRVSIADFPNRIVLLGFKWESVII